MIRTGRACCRSPVDNRHVTGRSYGVAPFVREGRRNCRTRFASENARLNIECDQVARRESVGLRESYRLRAVAAVEVRYMNRHAGKLRPYRINDWLRPGMKADITADVERKAVKTIALKHCQDGIGRFIVRAIRVGGVYELIVRVYLPTEAKASTFIACIRCSCGSRIRTVPPISFGG